jgi:hypothetical protein
MNWHPRGREAPWNLQLPDPDGWIPVPGAPSTETEPRRSTLSREPLPAQDRPPSAGHCQPVRTTPPAGHQEQLEAAGPVAAPGRAATPASWWQAGASGQPSSPCLTKDPPARDREPMHHTSHFRLGSGHWAASSTRSPPPVSHPLWGPAQSTDRLTTEHAAQRSGPGILLMIDKQCFLLHPLLSPPPLLLQPPPHPLPPVSSTKTLSRLDAIP